MKQYEVGPDGELPFFEGKDDCVQVIVVDKRNKDAEVTFLNGTMCVDGMGSPFMVYVSSSGYHRTTKDLKVGMAIKIEGQATRKAIPDIDPENKP